MAALGPDDSVRLKRFMSRRRVLEALAESHQMQESKRSSSAVANGSVRADCRGRRMPHCDFVSHQQSFLLCKTF